MRDVVGARVGDGTLINIWEDDWVLGLRRIPGWTLTLQDQDSAVTIQILINDATLWWNIEKSSRSYYPKLQQRYSKFHNLRRPNRMHFSGNWKNRVSIACGVLTDYARMLKNMIWEEKAQRQQLTNNGGNNFGRCSCLEKYKSMPGVSTMRAFRRSTT